MAISPLETRANLAQLADADTLEQNVNGFLRRKPMDSRTKRGFEFIPDRPRPANIVLSIVAERFRRVDWHVETDFDAGRLTFNDATPEF